MPKYVSGYGSRPDICLQPSHLEFLLDTKQPLSMLYHVGSHTRINKQETAEENSLCLLETDPCAENCSIYFAVSQQSNFHNNGDNTVKPAQVQNCRHAGIHTQSLLQGLTPPFALGVSHTSRARNGAKQILLWVMLKSQRLLWTNPIFCWPKKTS